MTISKNYRDRLRSIDTSITNTLEALLDSAKSWDLEEIVRKLDGVLFTNPDTFEEMTFAGVTLKKDELLLHFNDGYGVENYVFKAEQLSQEDRLNFLEQVETIVL